MRVAAIAAVVVTGLVVTGVICLVAYLAYIDPDFQQLEATGDGMVRKIEAFREQHSRYPLSAQEAGVVLPETRWGDWKYETHDGGETFMLSIGEYEGFDPFVLSWDSNNGNWYRDT